MKIRITNGTDKLPPLSEWYVYKYGAEVELVDKIHTWDKRVVIPTKNIEWGRAICWIEQIEGPEITGVIIDD